MGGLRGGGRRLCAEKGSTQETGGQAHIARNMGKAVGRLCGELGRQRMWARGRIAHGKAKAMHLGLLPQNLSKCAGRYFRVFLENCLHCLFQAWEKYLHVAAAGGGGGDSAQVHASGQGRRIRRKHQTHAFGTPLCLASLGLCQLWTSPLKWLPCHLFMPNPGVLPNTCVTSV